jgi:hypothetical protein
MEAPVESLEFGGEVYDVGPGRKWSDNTTAVKDPLNMYVPSVQDRIQFQSLELPSAIISQAFGAVNANVWHGWPVGTVMFMGVQTESEWNYDLNHYKYRVTVCLDIRPQMPWNYVWRKDTGLWDYTIPILYPSIDFYAVLGF